MLPNWPASQAHFRPIGGGFFGHDDVHGGRVPEDAGEPARHPVRSAEDFRAHLRVSLVEPGGEADAAGDRIEFGHA